MEPIRKIVDATIKECASIQRSSRYKALYPNDVRMSEEELKTKLDYDNRRKTYREWAIETNFWYEYTLDVQNGNALIDFFTYVQRHEQVMFFVFSNKGNFQLKKNPFGDTEPIVPNDPVDYLVTEFCKLTGLSFTPKELALFRKCKDTFTPGVETKPGVYYWETREKKGALLTKLQLYRIQHKPDINQSQEYKLAYNAETTTLSAKISELFNLYIPLVGKYEFMVEKKRLYHEWNQQYNQELQKQKEFDAFKTWIIGRIKFMCHELLLNGHTDTFEFLRYKIPRHSGGGGGCILFKELFEFTRLEKHIWKIFNLQPAWNSALLQVNQILAKILGPYSVARLSEWNAYMSSILTLEEHPDNPNLVMCNFLDYVSLTREGSVLVSTQLDLKYAEESNAQMTLLPEISAEDLAETLFQNTVRDYFVEAGRVVPNNIPSIDPNKTIPENLKEYSSKLEGWEEGVLDPTDVEWIIQTIKQVWDTLNQNITANLRNNRQRFLRDRALAKSRILIAYTNWCNMNSPVLRTWNMS